MDRSIFISDPILTGLNQRMLGFYAAFVQELSPYALIGFRTSGGLEPETFETEAARETSAQIRRELLGAAVRTSHDRE